jgi:hypothetical protein
VEGALEWIPLTQLDDLDLVEDVPVLLARIVARADGAPPFFARYWYDDGDRLRIAFAGDG